MHVLIYNWRDPKHSWAGGGEVYVFEQASRWVSAGHTVSVFCGQDINNTLPAYEKIQGVNVYRKGGRYTLYFWAIVYYFTIFRNAVDIIVDVENGIPFFTPLFSRKPKVCYVYHIHGSQFFYELPPGISHIGYIVERFVFPFLYKNQHFIAISETTKKQLEDIGISKKRIHIVYCGIKESRSPSLKGIKKFAQPTLLYLGRIKKYKRVDLLVDILAKVSKRIPKTKLIIAGWGTEASHLTDIIMKSPLRRKITLLGPVSAYEKKRLLSKSWVFVNPSIGEGWSIAVIEANLYGTPAAAFNVPGLKESIQHKKTGVLAKNKEELVDQVCEILSNKSYRERLHTHAIEWAKQFNWDRSAKESLKILTRIHKHTT